MNKLSIIIPCFNASKTLNETINSLFQQNLQLPYEIIIVDDASTDTSFELIKTLKLRHKCINYIKHDKNRGGGAARNTGIKNSSGNIIFCIDSDDILPPNILSKLIKVFNDKACDGVIFEESRFFNDLNGKIHISKNKIDYDSPINLSNLFSGNNGFFTTVNFLFSKEAYLKTNGYPENHGFDTQAFGYKFLFANDRVFIAPNTYYFHRQGGKSKSYFEREYEKGEFSKNYYLIYENILFLLSNNIRREIIKYNIFEDKKNSDLLNYVNKLYNEDKSNFFLYNFEIYKRKDGHKLYYEDNKNSLNETDLFCFGISFFQEKKFYEALNFFVNAAKYGLDTRINYFNILRCIHAITNTSLENEIENDVIKLLKSMQLNNKLINLNPNLLTKIMNKLHSFKLKLF